MTQVAKGYFCDVSGGGATTREFFVQLVTHEPQLRAACPLGNILRRKQCAMIWVAVRVA